MRYWLINDRNERIAGPYEGMAQAFQQMLIHGGDLEVEDE